jgi:hypothetical protein
MTGLRPADRRRRIAEVRNMTYHASVMKWLTWLALWSRSTDTAVNHEADDHLDSGSGHFAVCRECTRHDCRTIRTYQCADPLCLGKRVPARTAGAPAEGSDFSPRAQPVSFIRLGPACHAIRVDHSLQQAPSSTSLSDLIFNPFKIFSREACRASISTFSFFETGSPAFQD